MPQSSATTLPTNPAERSGSFRYTLYRLLETAGDTDKASRIVDAILICFILASVVSVILESIPTLEARYGTFFTWFEVVTISIFSVEYFLRIWSSVERSDKAKSKPFTSRLKFALSFGAIVDLLAILPYYLLMFGLLGNVDTRFLRSLRLLRTLKLTRYFAALNMLVTTVIENGRALAAAFLILVTVMLLAASGMYYFERESQPVDFGSIPAAMWWAFATLTTVGYGDVTPITVGGKIFGALITVVGIGMVALPTSILASGYTQQLRVSTKKYRRKADEALDDGIVTEDEHRDLEKYRLDLGIGKAAASQILDEEKVRFALQFESSKKRCPHCREVIP